MSSKRFYRHLPAGKRFRTFTVGVKETDLWIAVTSRCYDPAFPALVEQLVWRQRRQLENFMAGNPAFATAMQPLVLDGEGIPGIVLAMVEAANRAGVGPMAAVAGVFSEIVGLFLLQSAPEVIVENGGDLFVRVVEPVNIGIYAGSSPLSGKIALNVKPKQTPLGICTSSGTIGPSYSLGRADAALVLSPSVPLADAAATALGNLVRGPEDLMGAIEFARGLHGVTGALVIYGDQVAAWGEIQLCPGERKD
ncbi:MAG: UPF0280 family protein [Bacillota bacterium]